MPRRVLLTSPATYRFGDFELNAAARRLLRGGRPVPLQPKPFALLLYLVRHRDRVVPREELLAEVWPGVQVNPQALGFALHAVRRAVGDDGERQAVIRTVPRAGLQFAMAVDEVAAEAPEAIAASVSQRPVVAASPFLGRERLVAQGSALLGEVRAGAGRILLLSGEAGIGKTRALERVADLATGEGFRVLHGRCVESEGAPAFWPWVQILRAAVSDDPPSGLLRVLGEGAREVAWMVPELRPYVTDLPQAPTVDARAARFLLFDSVTTFLRELVSEAPYLLCIDDLHRADAASAALFQHVCRELAPLRMALVATYRENELRASPALADALPAISALPHCRHEPLLGLGSGDVGELVQRLSSRIPSKAVVADLHEKTNGNPFFLDQIVRMLGSEGRLGELEAAQTLEFELPYHVQDAIRRQLRLLPEAARELIELGSVIGRDFTLAELEGAADGDRAQLLAGLGEAVEIGVLAIDLAEPTRYRFCHALARDAIYAGLRHDRRAAWHARVGRAIERLCGSNPGPRSAEIAHHCLHAGDPAELDRAIEYCRIAARWASERAAVEEAPGHLETALALLDQIGADDDHLRCEILIQYGDALTQCARRDEARAALMEAASIAKRAGDAESLAQAALRYAPDFLAIGTGVVDWDLVHLLEEALECLGDGSPSVRSRVHAALAVALYWAEGDTERTRELCRAAREEALSSRQASARAFVRVASQFALYSADDPDCRVAASPAGLADREGAVALLERILRITALMQLGRFHQVDDEIDAYQALAIRLRHPQAMWYVGLLRSTRALMKGNYDEARVHAVDYLKDGRAIQDPNALQSFRLQALLVSVDRGGLREREAEVREMVARFPRVHAYRAALTFVYSELGEIEKARLEMRRTIASGCLRAKHSQAWLGSLGALAIASRTLADASIARAVYDELLPFAGQFGVVGFGSYCWGSIDRFLGAAAIGMGELSDAIHYLRRAVVANEAAEAVPLAAHAYYDLSVVLAMREEAQAEPCLGRALELARLCRMTRLEQRIELNGVSRG